MRHRLALLGATLAVSAPVGIAATAPASAATYPAAARSSYQKACVKSAKKKLSSSQAKRLCTASLKCIERKLTLKQFAAFGRAVAKGDKTPPHEKVVLRCVKQAAKSA